jgi:hypothetical protein
MGAWGRGRFENDSARDWLADFEDEGADAVEDALMAVTDEDAPEYVEADEACCALAVAELVAAARTGDDSRLPEEARPTLDAHRDDMDVETLAPLARRAILRIRTSSELKDLCDETDDFDAWMSDLDALADRLR